MVKLIEIDRADRVRLLRGDLGGREAAPGWPHDDTAPGLGFLDSGGTAYLVIDDEGRIAGECGTKTPPSRLGAVEIGYGLAAPSRGRGLGTRAVALLLERLAHCERVHVIEAEVQVGNEASARLLLHHGFVELGDPVSGFQRYRLPVGPTGVADPR
jgi:RimJ/RimL family protein N-acetyltransferase